jgi:anti-sigma regulatory factor (Ser/Thr protein kinase)
VIARRKFDATEESVGQGRRFVLETIADLPDELQDAVSLMVSELATNALVHATSGFEIDIDRSDASLIISLTDRGTGTPAVQSPASSEPHGRGLRIVEALSDRWGIRPSTPDAGKTVWFQLSLRQRPSIEHQQADAFSPPEEHDQGRTPQSPRPAPTMSVADVERSDQPSAFHRCTRQPARANPRTRTRHQPLARSTA